MTPQQYRWLMQELKAESARFWIREDVYYLYAYKQCEAETGEGNLW